MAILMGWKPCGWGLGAVDWMPRPKPKGWQKVPVRKDSLFASDSEDDIYTRPRVRT